MADIGVRLEIKRKGEAFSCSFWWCFITWQWCHRQKKMEMLAMFTSGLCALAPDKVTHIQLWQFQWDRDHGFRVVADPCFFSSLAGSSLLLHLPSSFIPPDLPSPCNKIFALSSVFKSTWNFPYWIWIDIASHSLILLSAFPPCLVRSV